MLVAGVDSSPQLTTVLLCRSEDGTVVARGSAPHPSSPEGDDPAAWWSALQRAGDGLLGRAAAVAVAGQRQSLVAVDEAGEVIKPASPDRDLLASAAAGLVAERGGPMWWATQTGSVPDGSFPVATLRWLADHEPARAARIAEVMLPHDWLTWRLGAPAPVTDRGDASGTGYFSPAAGRWLPDVAATALGHQPRLPRVADPCEVVGETAGRAMLAAGTGDIMAAALGLGLQPGEVAVSVGASGAAFAVTGVPAADPTGAVAGFADATGRFLPAARTVNAGLVLTSIAELTGVDLAGLSERALAAEPGAGGVTLLPYLGGERIPPRPRATGVLQGLTTANATGENLARAAVESVLASLASVADLLAGHGVERQAIRLVGPGARAEAVRRLAPGIFGVPVDVPESESGEHVALGAARQAAWAAAGSANPPGWPARPSRRYTGVARPRIQERFAALRDATAAWGRDPAASADV